MSAQNFIRTWCARDGSLARIEYLPPGITIEDVELELKVKGIKEGVDWDSINAAIEKASASGQAAKNIIAARASDEGGKIKWGSGKLVFCDLSIDGLKKMLEGLYRSYMQKENETEVPAGIYVEKGEVFLEYHVSESIVDIFGGRKTRIKRLAVKVDPDSVFYRDNSGKITLAARKSGYAAINSEGRFCIFAPLIVSEEGMEMRYLLAPVRYGFEKLIEGYDSFIKKSFSDNTGEEVRDASPCSPEEASKKFEKGIMFKEFVKKGRAPFRGKDAVLERFISNRPENSTGSEENIDFHEISPYQEVFEGTLIARKSIPIKSIPGIDVFGNEIPVEKSKDIEFKIGGEIIEDEGSEYISYFAGISGIIEMREKSAILQEKLHIKGDVGAETGNLEYSKDIIIDGNITGGYRVKCGGSLEIKGNVENHAVVECEGKCVIKKGVFGTATIIKCSGDLDIGFVQDCTINSGGNLRVSDYVYNSNIFVSGEIVVIGSHVRGERRGAVIGGNLNCMRTMQLHSAGSSSARTGLVCGVNLKVLTHWEKLNDLVPVLTRKAMSLQDSLGVNIYSPRAREKLKSFSEKKKEEVRKKLSELKEITSNRERTEKLKSELEDKMYTPENENISVCIKNQLIPDVMIRIRNKTKLIQEEGYNIVYRVKDNLMLSDKTG
ncbi:MAG: DUF342 domain-containing protein [Fibrobacterota bacterium]